MSNATSQVGVPYASVEIDEAGKVTRRCPDCDAVIGEPSMKGRNYAKHYAKAHGR
jgi:uncharacterized C2H2 Zn-finger protein